MTVLTTPYYLLQGIGCHAKMGLRYEGKCYFTPYISYSSKINYEEAVQKCDNVAATMADIHSRNQQKAFESFFRQKIPSSQSWMDFWTGMVYQSSVSNKGILGHCFDLFVATRDWCSIGQNYPRPMPVLTLIENNYKICPTAWTLHNTHSKEFVVKVEEHDHDPEILLKYIFN